MLSSMLSCCTVTRNRIKCRCIHNILKLASYPVVPPLSFIVAQWLSKLQDFMPAAHPVSGRTEANLQNNMYLPTKARCRGLYPNREARYVGTEHAPRA
jgi:hypothetical protein